jgi:hypothetical protein
MANKKHLWGMLAMALVFGTVLLGCPTETETEEEKDTWSNVTSLEQMNGTWKYSYSQTLTIKEMTESQGETWTDEMSALYGDMKITISMIDAIMTINASAKTQAFSGTQTMTYSGGNIDTLWATIKQSSGSQSGVITDDAKHSLTMTINQPAQTMTDEQIARMLAGGVAAQINQNGSKLKRPAGNGQPEVIMIKQ